MADDKNRLRKTYSFYRQQPVYASGGGGGGGGGVSGNQFWFSTTTSAIYTTGSVIISGGEAGIDAPTDKGIDLFFFVSGTIGSIGLSSGRVAGFGGDVVVTGSLVSLNGISGSLTRLTDGTSYLRAGSNVTITSASNGSVTIASTNIGTPAGSNQQIQFNNGGSFGASANLTFDTTNNVMSLTGSFGMKGNITPDADTTYNLGSSQKRWANVYTGDLHLRNDRGDWTIVEERDYLCVVNNITGKKYKMMLQPIED